MLVLVVLVEEVSVRSLFFNYEDFLNLEIVFYFIDSNLKHFPQMIYFQTRNSTLLVVIVEVVEVVVVAVVVEVKIHCAPMGHCDSALT
jgi:hypothetical protein